MNAYKFVEVNGLEKAKRHLNTQEVIIASGEIGSKEFNDAVEKEQLLSQAIADFELLNLVGYDIADSKQIADFSSDMKYIQMRGKLIEVSELKKAIQRIEQGLKHD